MHDFSCTDPKDMYYKILADRVRYFKEDEEGVLTMCRALTTDLDFSVYAESIAKLCNVSELEKTYHIRHSDDRILSSILKNPHS